MGDGAPTDSSTLTHILCGNPLSRAICREISDACRHGGCQGGESVARRATGAAPACGGEGVGETRPAPACGDGGVGETGAAPGCGGGGVSETGAAPGCGGGGVSETRLAPACGNGRVYETRAAPACGNGRVYETGAAPACGGGGVSETGPAPASRESPDIGVSLEAGVVWVSCCAREGVAGVVWVSRSARRGGVVRRSAGGAQGELPRPQLLSGVTGRSREGACCIRVDGGDGRETRETRSHVVNPSPRPLGTGKATIRSSHQQM